MAKMSSDRWRGVHMRLVMHCIGHIRFEPSCAGRKQKRAVCITVCKDCFFAGVSGVSSGGCWRQRVSWRIGLLVVFIIARAWNNLLHRLARLGVCHGDRCASVAAGHQKVGRFFASVRCYVLTQLAEHRPRPTKIVWPGHDDMQKPFF